MTAIARFEVIPVREGSMAEPIARAVEALEHFDVAYETTPTDTVIEAATIEELFAAVRAAHEAIADEGRVVTELEIDYQPGRPQSMDERVHAVERELGRPPRSEPITGGTVPSGRYQAGQRRQQYGEPQAPVQSGTEPPSRQRFEGGRRYGSRR